MNGAFEAPDVNTQNIDALSIDASLVYEKRICELSELADASAASALELFLQGFEIYEILGFISDNIPEFYSKTHREVMPENIDRLKIYLDSLSAQDKATFALFLTERMKKLGIRSGEADFLRDGEGDRSIVYVKNRLSDEAYDVFADMISDVTVSYVENFKEAALAVAEGKSEYCILPLEEKGGARLASIAAILFSSDLKIASVTPVFGFDGSADVKYALISKHFSIPDIDFGDDRYLEIRLNAESSLPLSHLFSAAEVLGASIYRVNTVKFNTEEGEAPYYTVVFKEEERDFSALLVFLTLFAGAYTAVGIYKNLE